MWNLQKEKNQYLEPNAQCSHDMFDPHAVQTVKSVTLLLTSFQTLIFFHHVMVKLSG